MFELGSYFFSGSSCAVVRAIANAKSTYIQLERIRDGFPGRVPKVGVVTQWGFREPMLLPQTKARVPIFPLI